MHPSLRALCTPPHRAGEWEAHRLQHAWMRRQVDLAEQQRQLAEQSAREWEARAQQAERRAQRLERQVASLLAGEGGGPWALRKTA